MYGYIYITTNLINNKKYIGQKKSDKFLGNNYLGSGKILLKAVNKYGTENFSVSLLEECYSEDQINAREQFWIKKYNAVEDNMFYNLSAGGEGTPRGSRRSNEFKEKIRKSASNRILGEDTRNKISKKVSSQRWINNGLIETKLDPEKELPNGFVFGRLKFTEEHVRKVVESKRRSYNGCSEETRRKKSEASSGSNNPFYNKKHSDETKMKMKEKAKGRIYITNGIICKRVKVEDSYSYLNNGWYRGMIRGSTTIESIAEKKDLSE